MAEKNDYNETILHVDTVKEETAYEEEIISENVPLNARLSNWLDVIDN